MSNPEEPHPLPQTPQIYPPRSPRFPIAPNFAFHAQVYASLHEQLDFAIHEVELRQDLTDFRAHAAAHWLGRIVYLLRAYTIACKEPTPDEARSKFLLALVVPFPQKGATQ